GAGKDRVHIPRLRPRAADLRIILASAVAVTDAARVWTYLVILQHGDIIDVINPEQFQVPIDRAKSGLTLEDIDAERRIVGKEELLVPAEEFRAAGLRGADAAGGGQLAKFGECEILRGKIHKDILADNGRVSFQITLLVRAVNPWRLVLIRSFGRRILVSFPAAKIDEPAIQRGAGIGRQRRIRGVSAITVLLLRGHRLAHILPR